METLVCDDMFVLFLVFCDSMPRDNAGVFKSIVETDIAV